MTTLFWIPSMYLLANMPSGIMVPWSFPVKILSYPSCQGFPQKNHHNTWFPQKNMAFPGHYSIFCHTWRRVFHHRLVFELCAVTLGTDWPVRLNDDRDLAGSGIVGKWSAKLASLWNNFLKNWELWDKCAATMGWLWDNYLYNMHIPLFFWAFMWLNSIRSSNWLPIFRGECG